MSGKPCSPLPSQLLSGLCSLVLGCAGGAAQGWAAAAAGALGCPSSTPVSWLPPQLPTPAACSSCHGDKESAETPPGRGAAAVPAVGISSRRGESVAAAECGSYQHGQAPGCVQTAWEEPQITPLGKEREWGGDWQRRHGWLSGLESLIPPFAPGCGLRVKVAAGQRRPPQLTWAPRSGKVGLQPQRQGSLCPCHASAGTLLDSAPAPPLTGQGPPNSENRFSPGSGGQMVSCRLGSG